MYCIIVNGGCSAPAMGCLGTFSVQPPPLSPWEFYGPLVCSVASDILIYNLILVKRKEKRKKRKLSTCPNVPSQHSGIHVSPVMEQIVSLPVVCLDVVNSAIIQKYEVSHHVSYI